MPSSMEPSSKAASETAGVATSQAIAMPVRPATAAPKTSGEVTRAAPAMERGDVVARDEEVLQALTGMRFVARGRGLPRTAIPWLGLVWRFLCTICMLGLLLFFIGTAIVWSSRQPSLPSSPLLNIEAIAGYGLRRHISIAVQEATRPQRLPSRRRPNTSTESTTTIAGGITTKSETFHSACTLDTTSFFCNVTVHGWYFNGERCQSTRQDEYKVCPGSTYQHKDESECESQWSPCKVAGNCNVHRMPLFPCSSGDLSRSWYFFNFASSSCAEWDFPEGACPNMPGAPVFDTKAACEIECNAATAEEKPECVQPLALMPCPADHMRNQYFYSDVLGSGGQCFRADTATLTGHRCVNRDALFGTEVDCNRTCVPNLGFGTPRRSTQ